MTLTFTLRLTLTKGRHPIFFYWAFPVKLRPKPPHLNGQGGPFFGRQKQHFSAYCQNQVQIDFDNENYYFCDETSNNFDDHGDENDQKRVCRNLFEKE